MKEQLSTTLKKYIPEPAVSLCVDWLISHRIQLRITKERMSKLGDYQGPWGGHGHRISVNHNLNPFSFLITFVHEMAHLTAFQKYKRIQAHGKEWKMEFRLLMSPFFHMQLFPADIQKALRDYLHNPAAATCSDQHLLRVLKRYDDPGSAQLTLEDLPPGAVFLLKSRQKLVLKKGPLLRSRYECSELNSKRIFFVNALAEVELWGTPQIPVF